jgi:hypothetical protein
MENSQIEIGNGERRKLKSILAFRISTFYFPDFCFCFQMTSANVRSILRKYQMPDRHSTNVTKAEMAKEES